MTMWPILIFTTISFWELLIDHKNGINKQEKCSFILILGINSWEFEIGWKTYPPPPQQNKKSKKEKKSPEISLIAMGAWYYMIFKV